MPPSKLWTPGGMVPIAEKDVVALTRPELIMLGNLHEFAQKHQLTIVCKRCDAAIQGKNSGNETTSAGVACQCTEFRFTR